MAKKVRESKPTGRLTEGHYYILSSIVNKLVPNGGHFVKWEPTALVGKPQSKAEAVSISRRLKSLQNRGLVVRSGNDVSLTPLGREALRRHAEKFLENKPLTLTTMQALKHNQPEAKTLEDLEAALQQNLQFEYGLTLLGLRAIEATIQVDVFAAALVLIENREAFKSNILAPESVLENTRLGLAEIVETLYSRIHEITKQIKEF